MFCRGISLGVLLETVVFQTMAVDASVSYGDESPPVGLKNIVVRS